MSPPASTRHFTGLHHYEGEAYGPFGFLNPTARRVPLPIQKAEGQSSQAESLQNGSEHHDTVKATTSKDDIRANDVHRLWRSRDNRKGNSSVLAVLIVTREKASADTHLF
jgi:hypothetical protein